MRSLVFALLLVATPAFAGNPFCRVQQKVIVQKQVVAHPVFAHSPYYYSPVGYQQATYRTRDELDDDAIDRLADRLAQKLGLPTAYSSGSIVDSKCGKCHRSGSGNDDALGNWEFDSVPLGWKDAARAQYGIVHASMAQKAKLTDDEQNKLVAELTSYLTTAASAASTELPEVPPVPTGALP